MLSVPIVQKRKVLIPTTANESTSEIQSHKSKIDTPLPLENVSEQRLYRKGYVVSYNKDTKLPNWVAWRLTADHVNGEAKRPGNAWHEDNDVPAPRANYSDYKGSGWTRGHMCPAGDNKWDADAMYETFLYTNCCPQNANLNSGTWNQIEIACRKWAQKYGEVDIVCGPILFRQEHEVIGGNKVVVLKRVILDRQGSLIKANGAALYVAETQMAIEKKISTSTASNKWSASQA